MHEAKNDSAQAWSDDSLPSRLGSKMAVRPAPAVSRAFCSTDVGLWPGYRGLVGISVVVFSLVVVVVYMAAADNV